MTDYGGIVWITIKIEDPDGDNSHIRKLRYYVYDWTGESSVELLRVLEEAAEVAVRC